MTTIEDWSGGSIPSFIEHERLLRLPRSNLGFGQNCSDSEWNDSFKVDGN